MAKRIDRDQIKHDILRVLRNNGRNAFRPKEIANKLDYRDTPTYQTFRDVLFQMADSGEVVRARGNRFAYKKLAEGRLQGTLQVHPDGFGFVTLEDEAVKDVYISSSSMKTALDGDRVEICLLAPARGDRRQEGEVVRVLERTRKETVGTYHQTEGIGYVASDDQRLIHDVMVSRDHSNGAKTGDKVLVSIDRFVDHKSRPEGRVLQVIGESGAPGVAVQALAMSRDVRFEFPPAVLKESETISDEITDAELSPRLDLRRKRIFTIDPFDAKDFDDAIHIEKLPSGNYEVGVHIADVSHYVRPGTAMEEEGFKRATSVYLVDRVVPMLPEKVSNKVCSLRPNEDKLTYSCILEVSPGGKTVGYEIQETIIRSKLRLTYEEAQIVIEGANPGHDYAPDILEAHKLASTLRKKRFASGSVDFSTPEAKVILNEEGEPVEIIRKEQKEANHLIEEFMLLANKTVARHIGKAGKKARPFIYRVHDLPDSEKITTLAEYVHAFGYDLKLKGGTIESKELNRLLHQVRGAPEAPVIEEAALRSMAKAKYATQNIGHFGLGFSHYTHFTSPIRRYPDLIVHRLLKHYHAKGSDPNLAKLSQQAEHCSERERSAQEAERESVKLKQVEYMTRHVGDRFDGVVSGVTKFGVFVELGDILVEGLVHVREMTDDYYEYDEKKYMLVGQYSRRKIRLGDPVRVKVTGADVENRRIDFVFAD